MVDYWKDSDAWETDNPLWQEHESEKIDKKRKNPKKKLDDEMANNLRIQLRRASEEVREIESPDTEEDDEFADGDFFSPSEASDPFSRAAKKLKDARNKAKGKLENVIKKTVLKTILTTGGLPLVIVSVIIIVFFFLIMTSGIFFLLSTGATVASFVDKDMQKEFIEQGVFTKEDLSNWGFDNVSMEGASEKQQSMGSGSTSGVDDSNFMTQLCKDMAKGESGQEINSLKDLKVNVYLGILDDGAGKNYGSFSFTANHTMKGFVAYMQESFPKGYATLNGKDPNSAEFEAAYTGLPNDSDFINCYVQYAMIEYLKPALAGAKKYSGIDFNDGTHTSGEISFLWELSNWGPAYMNTYVSGLSKSDSPEVTIDKICANAKQIGAGQYTASVHARWDREAVAKKKYTAKGKI